MKLSKLKGVQIQVTRERILKDERDPNLFYYEIRHSDNHLSSPVQIKKDILVNFYGTIVAKEELPLNVASQEVSRLDGTMMTYVIEDIELDKAEKRLVNTTSRSKELKPWK